MAKSIYNSFFDKNKSTADKNNANLNSNNNLEKDSKDSKTEYNTNQQTNPLFKQKKAIVIETQNHAAIVPQTTIVQHQTQTQTFFDPTPASPTVIAPANTIVTATMTQPAMTAVN